jgi:hypothetical protein
MTLKTLADVQALLRHLPAGHEQRPAWRHVTAELAKAAAGADAADVSIALQMVLSMEGRSRAALRDVLADHADALPQQDALLRMHRHRNVVSGISDHDAGRGSDNPTNVAVVTVP